MKLATLTTVIGTIALVALTAIEAQARGVAPQGVQPQAAGAQVRATQPAGPVGGTTGTCGTESAGNGRPAMHDYRRAGDIHHAVVGGLQQLAAIDAAIVAALDGIARVAPQPAPATPHHTLAALLVQRARIARQIQEQPLDPIYLLAVPVDGWTLELLAALQRIESMARAGLLGRTEYMVLRKHLIQTLESQQQAFAAAAGLVVEGAGPHRRLRPRPIGIAP